MKLFLVSLVVYGHVVNVICCILVYLFFAMVPLFMAGGAIPPSRYTLLTLVCFRKPVMARHVLLSSGSIYLRETTVRTLAMLIR